MTQRRTYDERGSISIWVITATLAMMILVGLAVDLGGQVHAQQRAHDVAAQAARTGGQQVQAVPAVEGRYVALDTAAARQAAEEYLAAAGVEGTVTVSGGNTLTVNVTDIYAPTFLSLIGVGDLKVTGDASARLIRTTGGVER
ncbi:MAG TPA: pilus assembly protein TadG-related protein [Nocardioides sp.]